MTTRTSTIITTTTGIRALVGASAAGLAVLGGVLLWQTRPAGEGATPAATTSIGTVNGGVTPIGGLAEQYRETREAQIAGEAARMTTRGGMGELYGEWEAERVAAEAARWSALGGQDTPYR